MIDHRPSLQRFTFCYNGHHTFFTTVVKVFANICNVAKWYCTIAFGCESSLCPELSINEVFINHYNFSLLSFVFFFSFAIKLIYIFGSMALNVCIDPNRMSQIRVIQLILTWASLRSESAGSHRIWYNVTQKWLFLTSGQRQLVFIYSFSLDWNFTYLLSFALSPVLWLIQLKITF